MTAKKKAETNDYPFRRVGQLFLPTENRGLILWTFWVSSDLPLKYHATKSDAYRGQEWSNDRNDGSEPYSDYKDLTNGWKKLEDWNFIEAEKLKTLEEIIEMVSKIKEIREKRNIYFQSQSCVTSNS